MRYIADSRRQLNAGAMLHSCQREHNADMLGDKQLARPQRAWGPVNERPRTRPMVLYFAYADPHACAGTRQARLSSPYSQDAPIYRDRQEPLDRCT